MEKEYKDKKIICKDCGIEFTFEAGQQKHFESLGFTNDPVRCDKCRAARKRNSNNSSNRNRDNRAE